MGKNHNLGQILKDHNLGQILNCDPASSYFPLKSKSDDGSGGEDETSSLFFHKVGYFALFVLLKLGLESPFAFWNKGNNIKRSERTF